MATKTSRGVALIPLTITYGVDRSDVTIPQSIPLVELLPGMVETVGAFTDQPTNDGFSVRTASGRLLDQSKSLSAQGVRAGAALTLEPLGEGAADMVYDDLTEAVGQVVERVSTPWTRDDARILAALSAAALIFVAALLLATTPPDALASLTPSASRCSTASTASSASSLPSSSPARRLSSRARAPGPAASRWRTQCPF